MIRTPFQFQKREDEKDLKEASSAFELALQVAGDRARVCLSQDDFKAYREDYRKAQDKLVDYLIRYNKSFHKNGSVNIDSYAMNISNLLTKIESLRSLLEVVLVDAKKGSKVNE